MARKANNFIHYLILLGILIIAFLAFWVFSWDKLFQIGVTFALAFSYISWGIIHHYFQKDLCLEIVVEYISIAILGAAVLLGIILSA